MLFSDCISSFLPSISVSPDQSLSLSKLHPSLLQLGNGKGAVYYVPDQWEFPQFLSAKEHPAKEEPKGTAFFHWIPCSASIHPRFTQPVNLHSNRLMRRNESRFTYSIVIDRPSPAKVILRFQPYSESSGVLMDQNGYKREFEVGEGDECDG